MSFSLFTKSGTSHFEIPKNGEELCLIIGIESGLVRGSLVLFSQMSSSTTVAGPGIPPRIFHSVVSEIAPREIDIHSRSSAKILSAMLDAVSSVSEKTIQEGLKITSSHSITIPVSKIHVIFSSPWIISKTKTIKISYEKETEVTKTIIKTIVDEERHALEQKFLADHSGSRESDLAFIEQKIFEVKLNGYPTNHFEDKKTRELEVSFAISISSKSILSAIEQTIEKSVRTNSRNIEYHSSLLLQYSALRNLLTNSDNYIAIHIHNEISDLIIVKNGVCAAIASFPEGTAGLSRASSLALGQSKEITHSSLNLVAKNALHPTENLKIKSVARKSTDLWLKQFTDTLTAVGQSDSTPHYVYLLTDMHYSYYEHALASLQQAKPITVTPIEKSSLDSAVSHQYKEKEDPLMSLYVFALQS